MIDYNNARWKPEISTLHIQFDTLEDSPKTTIEDDKTEDNNNNNYYY